MTGTIRVNEQEDEITIAPHKRFDLKSHIAFRESYLNRTIPHARYVVDLTETEYMDSQALGMLLKLREHANGSNGTVVITNCKPEIRKILAMANFDRLFEIK